MTNEENLRADYMGQQNEFCINCKHCRKEDVHIPDVPCMILKCACVYIPDIGTGKVTYKSCREARYLINGESNSPTCDFFRNKKKLSIRQRIKRFFCGDEAPFDGKKSEIEEKHTCSNCKYNCGLYCNHPDGNCYDSKDAETKWKAITKEGGEE